jgi:hypothetical protein
MSVESIDDDKWMRLAAFSIDRAPDAILWIDAEGNASAQTKPLAECSDTPGKHSNRSRSTSSAPSTPRRDGSSTGNI